MDYKNNLLIDNQSPINNSDSRFRNYNTPYKLPLIKNKAENLN